MQGWAWLTAWLVYREDYVALAAQLRWLGEGELFFLNYFLYVYLRVGAAATNNSLYGESYYYDCIRLHQTG